MSAAHVQCPRSGERLHDPKAARGVRARRSISACDAARPRGASRDPIHKGGEVDLPRLRACVLPIWTRRAKNYPRLQHDHNQRHPQRHGAPPHFRCMPGNTAHAGSQRPRYRCSTDLARDSTPATRQVERATLAELALSANPRGGPPITNAHGAVVRSGARSPSIGVCREIMTRIPRTRYGLRLRLHVIMSCDRTE